MGPGPNYTKLFLFHLDIFSLKSTRFRCQDVRRFDFQVECEAKPIMTSSPSPNFTFPKREFLHSKLDEVLRLWHRRSGQGTFYFTINDGTPSFQCGISLDFEDLPGTDHHHQQHQPQAPHCPPPPPRKRSPGPARRARDRTRAAKKKAAKATAAAPAAPAAPAFPANPAAPAVPATSIFPG